jgi:hypothetical protein
MSPKIFFAAVPQPHPQGLRDFLFLFLRQRVVEGQGFFSFATAGCIIMGIPVAASHSDTPTDFFHQGFAFQGGFFSLP